MNKTLYILTATLLSHEETVQGVTDDKAVARAYMQINRFGGVEHSVELVTMNVLDGTLIDRIQEWLNSKKNPLCKCGHRFLHHRNRGIGIKHTGSCLHNVRQKMGHHACKGFVLAEEQPQEG
jgi:hypothetical protein